MRVKDSLRKIVITIVISVGVVHQTMGHILERKMSIFLWTVFMETRHKVQTFDRRGADILQKEFLLVSFASMLRLVQEPRVPTNVGFRFKKMQQQS